MRCGRDQRLADHLAAEHALPADLRAQAAKQILLELFEIEDGEQLFDLGAYYGIVTSAFVSLAIMLAMFEQLGWRDDV